MAEVHEVFFAPLIADPKEPHFFATVLRTRVQAIDDSVTLGSVGFGEEFGLWGRRDARKGWQIGLQAGVMAQFDLDAANSYPLINADYVVGIPVAWRRERASARLRFYHQSSHLGDEYLLQNPGATRIDVSFEELEGIVAYAIAGGHGRAYFGGGLLLHRHPAMERGKLLAGVEWRGRSRSRSLVQHRFMSTLVAGAELKLLAADDWNLNLRAVLGVELLRPRGTGGVRVLAEYYHGSFPYGQFFHEKVDQLGLGIHLGL